MQPAYNQGVNTREFRRRKPTVRPPQTPKAAAEFADGHHEHAPIKRFGTAEELAHFFVFLCSDKATYSVGSTYFVDGGMLKTVM